MGIGGVEAEELLDDVDEGIAEVEVGEGGAVREGWVEQVLHSPDSASGGGRWGGGPGWELFRDAADVGPVAGAG